MTDKTELLPCPFCGGEADVMLSQSRWGQSYTIHHDAHAALGKCPAEYVGSMQFATEAKAIAAWNARAERTCEIESSFLNDFTSEHECWYEFEMQCGYKFTWDEMEPPRCCPNCGARVVA